MRDGKVAVGGGAVRSPPCLCLIQAASLKSAMAAMFWAEMAEMFKAFPSMEDAHLLVIKESVLIESGDVLKLRWVRKQFAI